MKKFLTLVITLISITSFAQTENLVDLPAVKEKYTAHNKGKFFCFWGWNKAYYSKSDIHFTGENYDFTIYDVMAHNRPKGIHIDYINPTRVTIPQTNVRIGYFINDKYSISLGYEHMKYVMDNHKTVSISGYYPNQDANNFGEYVNGNEVHLTPEFLTFEHTDGLNYINTEISRVDDISKLFRLPNTDKVQINFTEGIAGGVIYPKTNAKVFDKERHDEFHLSGYGLSAKAGLNITFFKYFFIQGELKGGYINLNNIRTTYSKADKAEQQFWFIQPMLAFGGIFRL
jgi:hypothetical protein